MNTSIIRNEKKNYMKAFTILVVIAFSILLNPSFLPFNPFIESYSEENLEYRPKASSGDLIILVDSEPIHIEGNQGWIDLKNEGNCTGSGTEIDPYIIRDIKINSTYTENAIFIENSDRYFIIEHTDLIGNSAIRFSNTSHGTIKNNYIHDSRYWYGISLVASNNNIISTNYFVSNGKNRLGGQIDLYRSNSNLIEKNIFENEYWKDGIRIAESRYNKVNNNFFNGHKRAIMLIDRNEENVIADNSLSAHDDSGVAIMLFGYSYNNLISGNRINNYLEEYTIWQDDYSENDVITNCFNGVYDPIHIDDSGLNALPWSEAALYSWCSGSGTEADPYKITNMTINAQKEDCCILIENSKDVYWVIENCELTNSGDDFYDGGLNLINTNLGKIKANNIHDNLGVGIIIDDDSIYNEISKNVIRENRLYGIVTYIKTPRAEAILHANDISNNEIVKNGVGGIFIDYGSHKIANNLIIDNYVNGIVMSSTCSLPVCIEANTIRNNEGSGLLGLDGTLNFTRNQFEKNGISLYEGISNSFIYENVFLTRGIYDYGINNQWHYNSIGNIYSNYEGIDANDDGMGDTPHQIPGAAVSYDNHPIWNDGIENEDIKIHIDDSSLFTFNWNFARIHAICTGFGLLDDPYIIRNMVIDGLGLNKGILIENSDSYFEIRDISIENSIEYGLKLLNVKNGLLQNTQIYGNIGDGVNFYQSKNNIIRDLLIYENKKNGIYLDKSDNNLMSDCIIHDNHKHGVDFRESDNNRIIGCTISNNWFSGIRVYYFCSDILIIKNKVYGNCHTTSWNIGAIHIDGACRNIKILENDISNNTKSGGIYVYNNCWNIEIHNNTIHFNIEGIYCADDYYMHNITISDNIITNCFVQGIVCGGVSQCLLINNKIFKIFHEIFSTERYGIIIAQAEDVIVKNNEVAEVDGVGITILEKCQNINVTNNEVCENRLEGIKIKNCRETPYIISQNKIYNNGLTGIQIINTNECDITGNTILSNGGDGIWLRGENNEIYGNSISNNSKNGIVVLQDSNSIIKNKIFQNDGDGIQISSYDNLIRKNIIKENLDIGILITQTGNNNLIYENILYQNNGSSIPPPRSAYYEGYDNGTNNHWDNGAIGNFWWFSSNVDLDGNGIGDVPVHFPFNNDSYPIFDVSGHELEEVSVSPQSSYPGEPILITCHFVDDWGIKDVFAHIKKSNEVLLTIRLYDDGSHSDRYPGDMLYSNTLDSNTLEATEYQIDIFYEDYLYVPDLIADLASFIIKVPRTLILVHGYSGAPSQFSKIYTNANVKQTYGDRIFKIDYYPRFMGTDITWWSPGIETIANLLKSYIESNHIEIRGSIDFVCHSMGGLVVRYLIKYHYNSLKQFYDDKPGMFEIEHVCHLATPNHGSVTARLGAISLSDQLVDMAPGSQFLEKLNDPDETPFDETIDWYTYRGGLDFVVMPDDSVPLEGAVEDMYYSFATHDSILINGECLNDLYGDLGIQGYAQLTLTETGVPSKEDSRIEVSSFVDSDLDLLNLETHLILENNAAIDPTSVKININPEYDMVLKSGTTSIYELNFSLDDGVYDYTITVLDFDGNQYSIQGELTIIDDDITTPSINCTYFGDYTDGNSGFIRVIASDLSGLSIDPSGDYPVPNSLGPHFFTFFARDNDNDRHNDSLSSTLKVSITIEDDDTVKPEININYFGSGTDGDPGYFSWNISDTDNGIGGDGDSGFSSIDIMVNYTSEDGLTTEEYVLSPIETGTWILPTALGTYTIEIIAIDNDDDRTTVFESLMTTLTEVHIIIDDDVLPPEITIEYFGSGTDGDPGFFSWEILDTNSGLSQIEIQVFYESNEGSEDYTINLPGAEYGTWNLPSNLGHYTINIYARDNDYDRTLVIDSLTTEISQTNEISDDDINSPELINLIIILDITEINVSFNAIDESGIGDISTYINGELVVPITQTQYGSTYSFIFENQWLYQSGVSEVLIHVNDGDNDRTNDALSSSITGTFENVFYPTCEYIIGQIEELKNYVSENLYHCLARSLNGKLSKAQDRLHEALNYFEEGKITCALFQDCLAKLFVKLAEFRTDIYDRKDLITDDHAEYIIESLREIRNNIVLLMGASIGEERAYEIALIEVELLNLKAFIEDEIPRCVGRYLGARISCAAKALELALFTISMGYGINCILKYTQCKLERTISKINVLLEKGKIPEEIANYLIENISSLIEDIEQINNN